MDKKAAIDLLRKYAPSDADFEGVLAHSLAVSKLASDIAERMKDKGTDIDVDFVNIASLLHDIGRFKVGPGKNSGAHGHEGALILRAEQVDESYARVCEDHIGISKDDVDTFGVPIPVKDYLPGSAEEKVIFFADKLFAGDRRISVDEVVKRFETELGPVQRDRFLKVYDWIRSIIGEV